jgi:hypothetical protein
MLPLSHLFPVVMIKISVPEVALIDDAQSLAGRPTLPRTTMLLPCRAIFKQWIAELQASIPLSPRSLLLTRKVADSPYRLLKGELRTAYPPDSSFRSLLL